MKLTDAQITEAIYRVCLKDEPIKAVVMDIGCSTRTIEKLVSRYEAR